MGLKGRDGGGVRFGEGEGELVGVEGVQLLHTDCNAIKSVARMPRPG